jgi:hypothetical protein
LLAYTESVDDMSGWLRTSRAKPAMKKCVDLAVKYQIADSRSLVCSRWLETNDKAAYPVVDEILPPFAGLNGARGAPVAPLYVRVE